MRRVANALLFSVLLSVVTLAQSPQTKSLFFNTSDGVRLHYLEAGQGPAIVFVPGWTMPAWIWDAQIRELSKRYRVIAFDPRSQGESDKPTEGNFYVRRAQDIKELLEQAKVSNPVLVGWSLAVPELIYFSENFAGPDVRGYVLVDGFLYDKLDPEMSASIAKWMLQMQTNRKQATASFVRSMYKKPQSEDYLARVTEASLRTPTNSAVTLIFSMGAMQDWTPLIKKISRPVVYVYTSEEQKSADLMKSAIPATRLELFSTSGHALFVDDADRFNKLVDGFVAGLPATASSR